jgi:CRP-like cAMP-binding protein
MAHRKLIMNSADPHRRNRLLAALPDEAFASLADGFAAADFVQGQVVCEPGDAITKIIFPHDCILSIGTVMNDGRVAEVETIGSEGCFGFLSGLGDRHAINRCVVQIPGTASLLPVERLDGLLTGYPSARDIMMRYVKALVAHIERSVACSSLHPLDLRCCRKLLRLHDWAHRDTFALKQDYLAQTLGVRRATVGQVCARLQDEGVIRYSRGSITILDRARLEAASCECYGVIRRTYDRLLPKTFKD